MRVPNFFMFGTMRRHSTWLWAIIIVIIIISFVVFFSPNVQLGGGGDNTNFGTVHGRKITREEFMAAQRETALFYFLRFGEWPDNDAQARQFNFNMERESYNRILLKEQLRRHNIDPSDAAVAVWIRDLLTGSRTNAPAFNPDMYQRFVKQALEPKKLTSNDFERFARTEVGRQHLVSLFGLSGKLLTQQEIEELYRKDNQPMAVEVALFNSSNYLSQVKVDDAAVRTFFTNSMPNYRIPPRVQVAYVKFPETNFWAEAETRLAGITNINAALEAEYIKRDGTNFFKDKEGNPLPREEALKQIRQEEKEKIAAVLARQAASRFLSDVLDKIDGNPGNQNLFQETAAAQKLEVQVSQPFDERDGPQELEVPSDFARLAFSLTPENPVAQTVVQAEDGFYAIKLQNKIASEMPSFEQIRAKIEEDYKLSEASRMARQSGEAFQAAVTNAVAQGKTFDAVAAEQKVQTLDLPPFSPSTRSLAEAEGKVPLGLIQNIVGSMTNGQVSPYIPTGQGGVVVQLKEKLQVDPVTMASELPEFAKRVRDQRQFAAFAEWFQKQATQLSIPPGMLREETAAR